MTLFLQNLALMVGIGAVELIFLVVPVILIFVLWIWAIIDIIQSNFREPNQKVVWVLIVIFVPILGPILYFALGRSGRITS